MPQKGSFFRYLLCFGITLFYRCPWLLLAGHKNLHLKYFPQLTMLYLIFHFVLKKKSKTILILDILIFFFLEIVMWLVVRPLWSWVRGKLSFSSENFSTVIYVVFPVTYKIINLFGVKFWKERIMEIYLQF